VLGAFSGIMVIAGSLSWVFQRRMLQAMESRRTKRRTLLPDYEKEWQSLTREDRRAFRRSVLAGRAIENQVVASSTLREFDTMGYPPDYSRSLRLIMFGLGGGGLLLGLVGESDFLIVLGVAMLSLTLFTSAWLLFVKWRIALSVAATRRMHGG
jgi:hypothetical protein